MPGDDDLSVDFSKVGDWLKRKKKKAQPPVEQPKEQPAEQPAEPTPEPKKPVPEEKSEDDLSIDFKKIGSWFKKKESQLAHDESGKEELSFDFSKAFSWIKAHPVLVLLTLLLIFQFVPNKVTIGNNDVYLPWGGMYMRLLPQDLPITDGFATNHVYSLMKNQLSGAVNQQYPNLPDDRKNIIIEEEWQKLYAAQGGQIEQQVQAVKQQLQGFWQYEENGVTYTYMPDIDPYHYLRYARNYIEKGHIEDDIKDGKPIDTHMVAPLGAGVTYLLQPYVLAWQYKIMSIFNPKISLMQAATYFPIIFMLLSLIPAFLIGRRFAGNVGGTISATMIAIMPAILGRTNWGHADTDTWNVFFPLLLIYFYIRLIDSKNTKPIITWGLLAGLSTGLYAWAWMGGWWYLFDFLLAAFAILVLSEIIRNYNNKEKLFASMKHHALVGFTYFVSAGIFVSLMTSTWDFFNSVFQPFKFTIIKVASHPSLWPNVYTTVAELNPIDINGIISTIGGKLYFWIAVLGIVILLVKRIEGKWKLDLKYAPLFALWFIATMYASTKGVRFTLLLAPAFAVVFGIALGKIYEWVVATSSRSFNLPKKVPQIIMILIFAFMLSGQARAAYGQTQGDIPIMNDAWWNALVAIKDDSKPDAIINSWWDFGHHFKYVADRAVTFDGASQNSPMAHWIGRTLSTNNETEAIGILRMLDCGSKKSFNVLNEQFNDPVKSVNILKRMILVDRKEALAILVSEGVDEQEQILELTHCDPPENYFIASNDMIGKSGVWSHFGLWNFERAAMWITLKNEDKDTAVAKMVEWGYLPEKAEKVYFEAQTLANENEANAWISPWLGILGGSSDCGVTNNVIVCGNGVQFNRSSKDARISVSQGTGTPPLLVELTADGDFIEHRYNDSTLGVSAVIYPTGPDKYQSIMVSAELATSMFVRMYFLQGHGLKHFKEFNRQQLITGGEIIVYKVDWDGGDVNVYSGFKNLQQAEEESETTGAQQGNTVSVYYIGSLMDGSVFDSSIVDWKDENITIDSSFDDYELAKPLKFTVGGGQVIAGFDAAVINMNIGDEQIAQIPPNAAYGLDPDAHFLGNKTLRFKIKVVGIE